MPSPRAKASQPARLALIVGLVCAAAVAWFFCPVPPRRPFTTDNILGFAAYYTLITAGACAIAVNLIQALSRREIWRISAIAIWFAPLAIFLIERSTLAVAVAVILASALLLERPGSLDRLAGLRRNPAAGYARRMFIPADSIRLARQFPTSMLIAILAQLTAVAVILDRVRFAIVCSIAAVILLFSRLRPRRRPTWMLSLMTCLALFLTVGGLSRYLQLGGGYEGGRVAGAANHDRPSDASTEFDSGGGDYTGVIMFPEVEKHVMLVPPLPFMNRDLFSEKQTEPLTIPFYGAYWFFRYPHRRPPPSSIVVRGTPEKKSFRSTGRVPINMEAHQNLGKLFNLSCCSKIQIAVLNRDRYPGTVHLELIPVNTSLPGEPSQTLGLQTVESRPVSPPEDSGSMTETLTFPIPAKPFIQQFDELTIRFERARFREDRSAKVSIERFVLIPRGR